MGVELLSVVGNHTLDEHLLAFAQVVLLLLGKLYAFNLLRDEDIFRTHGDHLIGELVNADKRGDVFTATSFQFHDTSHIACFKQILLVLLGEDMPEVRAVKFGFLPDTVDAQHDGTSHGLLE